MSLIFFPMKTRYYAQHGQNGEGWSVYDRSTGVVADVNGVRHENVPGEDIDELVDMLNAVAARQRAVIRKASRLRFRLRRDRYYAREDADGEGWSVWDHSTGARADVTGSASSGLSSEDADDLVDTLNRIEAARV